VSPVDFEWKQLKGLSSFTMVIRCLRDKEQRAVLCRRLEGNENAILHFDAERQTFLFLGDHHIADRCLRYDDVCRIEEFYDGPTSSPLTWMTRMSSMGPSRAVPVTTNRTYRTSRPDLLRPSPRHMGSLARRVLEDQRDLSPPQEQEVCDAISAIFTEETDLKVQRCRPRSLLALRHNDT
jgi:hypothetical protein